MSASGCAHSWIDEAGQRHVLGLVSLQYPDTVRAEPQGHFTQIASLGVSLFQVDKEFGFAIGYNRLASTWINTNTCYAAPGTPLPGQVGDP